MLPTQRNGLDEIAGLAQLIGEWCEIATRVLFELLAQFVDPGSSAHPSRTLECDPVATRGVHHGAPS